MKKRLTAALLALILCLGLIVPASAAGFSDVPATYIFHDAIAGCVEKGIVSGYADGTFRPAASVTRAQFCAMLVRAFYPREDDAYAKWKSTGWFLPAAALLKDKGVMFYANEYWTQPSVMNISVTRADMAKFIANVMQEKGYTVSDAAKSAAQAKIADYASIDGYYQDAVKTVFALGIITGYADGAFGPHDTMTRGQGAVVISRMAQCMSAGSGTPVPVPEQTEAPTVLSSGKAVTEENVLEIINGLRDAYPEDVDFSEGYTLGNSSPVRTVTHPYPRAEDPNTHTSNRIGCGAWATLVSDAVFSQNGFPPRKVPLTEARPGDVMVQLNAAGQLVHVTSILSRPQTDKDGKVTFTVSQASTRGQSVYRIHWDSPYSWKQGDPYTYDIYTRYPA
ncbi:MAG: S-layer homology domain-containing protein [Oscillibacter sp.]|nr:S-layer homology domain-containing protein [Oscillibacter sp.]